MKMQDKLVIKIKRKSEIIKQIGISKSTLHARINQKLLPPPIQLGARAVGFLQHEIDTVLAAMIAGNTNKEIKLLVNELVAKRSLLAYGH
ncbi:MAG: prophage regulatory protein [Oleiphilaceae bacterium]|jgi:prophage regulatory protein